MMTAMTADPEPPSPPSIPERLLELQRIDTEADQLRLRRERVPERDDLAAKTEQLTNWERRRQEMRARIDELTEAIESADARSTQLGTDKARLEAQLKTVIAPREAEALMQEIATIDERVDELDTSELEAMEELAGVEGELGSHLGLEEGMREALGLADEALARVVADIDRELDGLAERRDAARAELDRPVLARYDGVRDQLGVAVALLDGKRCDGCHLDLSAAEVDTAKDDAATSGITDCPHCGRMLIV